MSEDNVIEMVGGVYTNILNPSSSSSSNGCKRKREEDEFDTTTTKNEKENENENHNNENENENSDNDNEWNEDEHEKFVSSIFEIGLKNASPAIVMENMISTKHTQKVEMITSERVKSKLQKYRNNKEKSKQEFMDKYCSYLKKIKSLEDDGTIKDDSDLSSLMAVMGSGNKLLGGDTAGYLTYAVMKECNKEKKKKKKRNGNTTNGNNNNGNNDDNDEESEDEDNNDVLSTNVLRKGARDYVDNYAGSAIQFPILTATEKKSSLGIAMTFIMGLFLSMSQHLTRERARAETIGLQLLSSSSSPPSTSSTSSSTTTIDDTTNK
jgi:SHAQKYF class myb-like DNA-binding protein